MTKKELQLIIKKVVKTENNNLKEDIVNMLSVLLEQVENNKALIESMNHSAPKQQNNPFRDKLMGNGKPNVNNNHPFNKPSSKTNNPIEQILKETHDEGEWRNLPDGDV